MKAQLLDLAVKEEMHWRQRCKVKCLNERDVKSGFFHRLVAARRRRSSILEVLSQYGRSLIEDIDIEQEFLSFYENLSTKKKGTRFLPHPLQWDPISAQCALLESPFTETEIWMAMKDPGHNKTPGLEGYTAEFYKKIKKYWNILKEDILRVFQDFFQKGIVNVNLNETCICLIPKKVDAHTVSDFRPIRLISCMYKSIARVLSERLKKVLSCTITPNSPLLWLTDKSYMHP